MSGGYGHIAKMARGNKQRTAQRKKRIEEYKKRGGSFSNSETELEFKQVSKEKVEEIKERYLKEIKKDKIKNRLLLFVSIIISIPLFYYISILFLNQIF